MNYLKKYQQNKRLLKAPEGFTFELINVDHTLNIIKWRNDPLNNTYFYDSSKYTLEKQEKFLDCYDELDRFDLVLMDVKNDQSVGVFSVKNLSTRPELGKMLGEKDYRGKGIAKIASFYLLQFVFNIFQFDKIVAETRKDNIANIRLNEKLGFEIINNKSGNKEKYYIMEITKKKFETLIS